MKHFIFIIVLFLLSGICFSQEGEVIDGIKKKLKKYSKNDSVKVELIIDLAWEYSFYDYRSAIRNCDEAIALSKSINYESGEATALSVKGNSYRALTIYDSAYYFLNRSLDIRKKQDRKNKIAAVMQNLANVYYQEGKTADAITKYKEAIKISEAAGDKQAVLVATANLASVYRTVGLTKKALESLNKAFEINKIVKDQTQESFLYATLSTLQNDLGNIDEAIKYGLKALEFAKKRQDLQNEAAIKNNLGMYYRSKNDLKQSFQYYQEAIQSYSEMGDSLSMAAIYNNFANVCMANNQLELALQSSLKALRIAKKEGDTMLVYNSLLTLADGYAKKKNFTQALACANEAKPLVVSMGIKKDLKDMYSSFADMYFLMKDYKNASEHMVNLLAYTDSINSENNSQLVTNLGVEMELNSKENEIELLNKNAEIKEIELDRQKNLRWFFAAAAFLFAMIGVITLFSYRRIKKANIIINDQKENLEIKNIEISAQKELVEEKQKEIIDSINYAKRIQTAVLTGANVWNKIAKEHFILFKPKDIVSGDFYWAYNTPNGRSIFALADCTGHGVPGGFMSMLGNSFLNEIVIDNKIFNASEILNKLRQKIISALDQEGHGQQKDGMDISLCVWNKLDNTLEFAGANNPLWILRSISSLEGGGRRPEDVELIEYKANKMPIGSYTESVVPFSSETIQLEKGDIIYLITDGFADQFGGSKGKKFKYRPLMELLIQHSDAPMTEQKIIFEKAIDVWKEGYEQVDDISLIGLRV